MSFQNIILVILILKTLWNSLTDNTPEFNLEDLLKSKLLNEQILPTEILNPCVMNSNNFIPQRNVIPSRNVCTSNFSLYKLIFLGFLIYLFFFIKDLLEQIGKNNEETENCNGCPFRFC